MAFLSAALSGWSAVLTLGAAIAIPYLSRQLRWPGLGPHYCLGLVVPAVAGLHATLAMSLLRMHRSDLWSLLLATGAVVLMIRQAELGLAVRTAGGRARTVMRRTHFRTMGLILALVAVHVALSRPA